MRKEKKSQSPSQVSVRLRPVPTVSAAVLPDVVCDETGPVLAQSLI